MASTGKVAVNPEHLRGHDGTVRNALMMWSCRVGPVTHNVFVSVYWSLVRDFDIPDEGKTFSDIVNEDQKVRNARIRKYYQEISEELHGPD